MSDNDPPEFLSQGANPTRFDVKGDGAGPGIVSRGSTPTVPPGMEAEYRSMHLESGDVLSGRFEVVKRLGMGGMGAVYHARDQRLEEDRALKVMLPSLLSSGDARRRFLEEIKISQKLSHDSIVRVHDLGEDAARNIEFYTMELVEGVPLNRLINRRGGKLPLKEAVHITRQLCKALAYAHAYTVHRDLKPQNLMVLPDWRIKVLDFGLAKLMSADQLSKSVQALGTAYYQAPEQAVHLQEHDPRADLYSVGVMLYEMLTGKMPVGRFKAPSKVIAGLPQGLDDVVFTCLEPEPDDRYDSAHTLDEALLAAQDVAQSPSTVKPQASASVAQKSAPARPAAVSGASGAGETRTFAGIEMVWCPPGTFLMGSPESEAGRQPNETQHEVTLTKGFWLGKYPVTQAQWQAAVGSNPSKFQGDNQRPVEKVSWNDCQRFVQKLDATGEGGLRLPTEAEWEYACRAGSTTAYCFGDNEAQLGDYAWFTANSGQTTQPVGQKKPNAWGLHAMHGHLWEWCEDWLGDYPNGSVSDAGGPVGGQFRVVRGGAWDGNPQPCRSAYRGRYIPGLSRQPHRFSCRADSVALWPVALLPSALLLFTLLHPARSAGSRFRAGEAFTVRLQDEGDFRSPSCPSCESCPSSFPDRIYRIDKMEGRPSAGALQLRRLLWSASRLVTSLMSGPYDEPASLETSPHGAETLEKRDWNASFPTGNGAFSTGNASFPAGNAPFSA